jgi:uncharacterized protein (DUF1778 family)
MTTAQPAATKTRDAAINIRALSHQRDLIDRAAEATGKNRSDFMLEAACRQAEEVLLDRRMFLLDDTAYSKFTSLLDRAPKDNPKLRALLSKKAPWDK